MEVEGKAGKYKFQLSVDNVAAPTPPPPPPRPQARTDMQRWSLWEFKVFRASRWNNLPSRRWGFSEQHLALPPDPAKGNKIQPARAQAQERFGAEIMVRGQTQGEATERTTGPASW